MTSRVLQEMNRKTLVIPTALIIGGAPIVSLASCEKQPVTVVTYQSIGECRPPDEHTEIQTGSQLPRLRKAENYTATSHIVYSLQDWNQFT
jgi:uncharacterized protein YgiB involved in biofilm formation